MITLQEFLHTPQFIMLALEKGHADYEDWFNRVFPNGAICDHDIIAALEHGINEAPAGSNSYSYDAVNKVLTVYNHLGVKSYCKDNNVALEEYNERVVIGSDFFDFSGLLKDCWSFNQPIDVPATVTTANNMFDSCYALNSPVTLHEGLEEASYMFYACRSFNQPIELPSTLVDARGMFCCAYRFNQEVHVGENVRKASHMFARCSSLSKDINVPGTIFDSYDCFDMCPFMSETGKAIKPTKTFDYDYDTDTVTVYSNRGVHDFCQMFNIAYTDFNKKVIIAEGIVVDVVINNAGIFSFCDILATPAERIERIILLHDLTVTQLCRLFAADMVRRGVRGHILNMSSYSLWMPFPGLALYSASKAYMRSFSVAFAKEVRERGIRVTALCPAGVATDLYGLTPYWQRIGRKLGVLITPDSCARRGLKALWKGRRCIVPDWWNRAWIPFCKVLPMWVLRPVRRFTMKFQK